jgi:hypothetical protein
MCEAAQFDRKHMPTGIWLCQKAIGLPKILVSNPTARE